MEGSRNLARRTAISNLPVALNIPYKVQRTGMLPNYGTEYISNIEQDNVWQGEMLFKWELLSFCVITQRAAVITYRRFATTLEVGTAVFSRNVCKKLPQHAM